MEMGLVSLAISWEIKKMNFITKLLGGSIAEPIDAIGNAFDKIFTSDEQRAKGKYVLEKLRQQPAILQAEINKIEAAHRSIFVAGWRPYIGWTCGLGLTYDLILRPLLITCGAHAPPLDSAALNSLVFALLGLGGLRTFEKFGNKTK